MVCLPSSVELVKLNGPRQNYPAVVYAQEGGVSSFNLVLAFAFMGLPQETHRWATFGTGENAARLERHQSENERACVENSNPAWTETGPTLQAREDLSFPDEASSRRFRPQRRDSSGQAVNRNSPLLYVM